MPHSNTARALLEGGIDYLELAHVIFAGISAIALIGALVIGWKIYQELKQ